MLTERMRIDLEGEEALASLGYERREIKRTLQSLEGEVAGLEDRLKLALRTLGKRIS